MPMMFSCWRCGKAVPFDGEPQERLYCPECAKEAEEEKEKLLADYSALRKRVMFETALRKMEKAGVYMQEYQDISKEVFKLFKDADIKLLSGDEIIAAMVLKSYMIDYEANYKIGPYTVDFFIPSMNVVLEIDGDRHEMLYASDNVRDINLRQMLGGAWEVIRISTPLLEKNPEKLPDAIEAVYAEKKRLRKKYNGIIPEYYSKREQKHYATLTPTKKVRQSRY